MVQSGHRSRKVLLRVLTAVALVVAIAVAVMSWPRHADASHVRMETGTSSRFTTTQLNDLLENVKERQMGYEGCTLEKIVYDEAYTNEQLDAEIRRHDDMPAYFSGFLGGINDYGRDRLALVRTEFTCGDGSDISLGTHNAPTYAYAYAPSDPKAGRDGWVYVTSGEC